MLVCLSFDLSFHRTLKKRAISYSKSYEFTCRGVSAYICIVNPDLRDVSFWLRHFVRLVRHKMRLRILVRRITLDDLMMREIGLTTMRQLMEKYLN